MQRISSHWIDQAGVVTSIAIQTAKYGKNVTGDYHDDDSSEVVGEVKVGEGGL